MVPLYLLLGLLLALFKLVVFLWVETLLFRHGNQCKKTYLHPFNRALVSWEDNHWDHNISKDISSFLLFFVFIYTTISSAIKLKTLQCKHYSLLTDLAIFLMLQMLTGFQISVLVIIVQCKKLFE